MAMGAIINETRAIDGAPLIAVEETEVFDLDRGSPLLAVRISSRLT
jgi:hypothetical protein